MLFIECGLLTSATVVDDTIRLYLKNLMRRSSTKNSDYDKEKSNEPDYDEDRDQMKKNKKRKQEK